MGDVCGPLAVIGHGDHSLHYSDFSAHVTIKEIAITMLSFSDHLRKSSCILTLCWVTFRKAVIFWMRREKSWYELHWNFFLNFA